MVQCKKDNYARYKIIKKSALGSQTAIFPTSGADGEGYMSVVGDANNAGSARVIADVQVEEGDELYFIAGELNKQISTSPIICYEPFKDEYSLKEYFTNNGFMHRNGEFDVMVDNKGAISALNRLDPEKAETDIDDVAHKAALYFDERVQYVGAYGNHYIHAGGDGQNVFYRFTAPKGGKAFIKDKIAGNGEYKIIHNGEKIYPEAGDSKPAAGTGGVAVSVDDVVLEEGDTLDFVVLGRGGSTKTHIEPIISYEEYQDIILGESKINLENGESYTLSAMLTAITGDNVIWESSAPQVASVTPSDGNASAEIVALTEGNATITVKSVDGTIVKTCAVKAYKAVAPSDVINIIKSEYECANAGKIYFRLNSESIVTFDKLIIKLNGAAAITINNFSGKRIVTDIISVTNGDVIAFEYTNLADNGSVKQIEYTQNNGIESDRIDFITSNKLLNIGDRVALEYTILPTASKDKPAVYTSDDESVVKIEEGNLVALKSGTATVTVSIAGGTATDVITVTVMTLGTYSYDSVKDFSNEASKFWSYYYLDHATAENPTPQTKPLAYNTQGLLEEINESGALAMGYKYVVGSSEFKEGVHNYLGIWNGEFMHPAMGSDVIMTFASPMKGTINIYDTVKALSAASDGTRISVFKNESKIFPLGEGAYLHLHETSVLAIENINVEVGDKISFVLNKNVSLNNDVTYLNPTIYYTECEVPDMAIVLNASVKELGVGGVFLLEGTISPDIIVDNNFTFTSSNEAVATVEDGIITAVAVGKATITVAHSSGISATCEVTVKAAVTPPPSGGGDDSTGGGDKGDGDNGGCGGCGAISSIGVIAGICVLVLALGLITFILVRGKATKKQSKKR